MACKEHHRDVGYGESEIFPPYIDHLEDLVSGETLDAKPQSEQVRMRDAFDLVVDHDIGGQEHAVKAEEILQESSCLCIKEHVRIDDADRPLDPACASPAARSCCDLRDSSAVKFPGPRLGDRLLI